MLDNIKNNVDFFIRNKTKFSRKNFVEKREGNLLRNYLENLYVFDILSQSFLPAEFESVDILDIGCKNFFYAQGEYQFFKTFAKDVFLDGVELDAYRLYSNFFTRYEVAKFYIKGNENIKYIADNLLNIKKQYDYITWFLPFVKYAPHKYWGLPNKYFMPEKLLEYAYSLLKPNGKMLIVNQGIEEAKIQKKLLEKLCLKYVEKGIVKSDFLEYKNDRYAFLIIK
ncbi:hypothetical protein IJ425_05580 [bacterium]|nr:hypothetical protein [bacterium]